MCTSGRPKRSTNESKVSRTFPSRTFLVDASFGKKVFVENTISQQAFSKQNHQGMKFKVFIMKNTTKNYQKMLQ